MIDGHGLAAAMALSALTGALFMSALTEPFGAWRAERAWWRGYRARDEEMFR